MKRRKYKFYKDLHEIRDRFGEKEYDRDDILPDAVALLKQDLEEGGDQELLYIDAMNSILDSMDKADDKAATGFFPYLTHVALGDHKRIKRGKMIETQLRRRKRLIDDNQIAQNVAWAQETEWINAGLEALEGEPPETTVEDVLPEELPDAAE